MIEQDRYNQWMFGLARANEMWGMRIKAIEKYIEGTEFTEKQKQQLRGIKMTNALIAQLKQIRSEVGYSQFDQAIKAINRERLGTQTEKRKPLPKGMKEKLYIRQSGICPRCQENYSINNMTDDHIVPIAHGGTNKSWNHRLVCKSCNSSKGDNTPLEESKKIGQTITEQLGGKPNV